MAAHASSLLAGFPEAYRDVVHFLARRTGNPDDARELAHDVWVRLAERERGGVAAVPDDPRAYLFTVAQNLAFDHLRKRKLVLQHAAQATQEEPRTPDVADALMYRQVLAIVDATLAALPSRACEAFVLHRMQGIGHAELARKFNVSRNTIERDVISAMDAIQSALEAWHAQSTATNSDEARRRGRRRSLAALLGGLAMMTTGAAAWRWWQAAVPTWQNAFATPKGRLASYSLPDGSAITLDADSHLTARFTGANRILHLLKGAAYFAVAHDAGRPFSVQASNVRVLVTGTRFAVEIEPSAVSVQVESGSVRVESAGGPALSLEGGEAVRIGPGIPPARSRIVPDAFTSWRHGELVFDRTSLGDAVARLDRYAPGTPATHIDAAAAALPVSGRVSIERSREWLAALPLALPIRVEPGPDGDLSITHR